jgi:hypothetical protein
MCSVYIYALVEHYSMSGWGAERLKSFQQILSFFLSFVICKFAF